MNPQTRIDILAMQECLQLAAKGEGSVSPNPLVGAVLMKRGKIVARGYHRFFGGPHAEVECLASYHGSFENTTLYVNLEPCSHYGKTPPCAELLAASPIPRIVIAMGDPNPLVGGRGIHRLRRAGKRVDVGILKREACALNRHFMTGILRHRPYIHVKIAQSLDAMIAAADGRLRWISGPEARAMVHHWRSRYDAVLVGAGTVHADNPRLTARTEGARHPVAVILDGRLSVSPDAGVFRNLHGRRVIVCTSARALRENSRTALKLEKAGVQILPLPCRKRISLPLLAKELYEQEIGSLFVEGGSDVFTQFLRSGLVDELTVFVAPRMIGRGVPAFTPKRMPKHRAGFNNVTTAMVGRDIMVQWRRSEEV
jgi:diaminohydroxyphosphoribosylaminopyrimidine deaminase/5-amino-6-(5-phosphoribosylamino)uracil reductase